MVIFSNEILSVKICRKVVLYHIWLLPVSFSWCVPIHIRMFIRLLLLMRWEILLIRNQIPLNFSDIRGSGLARLGTNKKKLRTSDR